MFNTSFGKKVCSLITVGILFLQTAPSLALNMGHENGGINHNIGITTKIIIGLLCCLLIVLIFRSFFKTTPQTRVERRRQLRKTGYFKRD